MTPKHCIFAALCLLAGGLASCSSNDDEQPANNIWTLNVKATKGDTPASRALSYDGTNITATWKAGETVDVRVYLELVTRGTLYAQDNGTEVDLKGTITGTDYSAAQDNQTQLSLWFPDYRKSDAYLGQNGTLEDIAAHFDYAHAYVTVESVDASNHVLTTTPATFVNAQAIVKFTLLDKNDKALSVSELTVTKTETKEGKEVVTEIANASLDEAGSVVWMAIPEVSDATIKLTATVGGHTYTFTKSPVTFAPSNFYRITVKMSLSN